MLFRNGMFTALSLVLCFKLLFDDSDNAQDACESGGYLPLFSFLTYETRRSTRASESPSWAFYYLRYEGRV